MTWYDNPGIVRDYRNDPRHPECYGIEPREFWVVSNIRPDRCYPIKVQGFLGAYEGRPNDYWCPQVDFTTRDPYIYETAEAACLAALDAIGKDQADIQRRLDYITKVLS